MSPRRQRAAFALLFYAFAALLLAAPLPLHVGSTVARAVRQDVWLNVWALAWTSEHLLTAPAALFDANIFFPHAHTLAYTDHFIGEALIAAPAYWITGSATLAYNLAWFAALVLTAWGGYLWVRCLIGDEPAGEAAALVAGAVCLLVPGKRTALSHLQVISLQGVTLSLFATHRLLQQPGWRRAATLTAAAAYAALCSWYTAAYTALLLPLVGLGGIFGVGRYPHQRRALAFGAAALLVVVVIMYPVALPYRAVQQEMAFERPLKELVATSLAPRDFVSSWSWLHSGWLPRGSGAGGYFPGLLVALLAVLGVWDGRRRGDRWPLLYAGGAAAFALLALGPRLAITEGFALPLPYEALYRWVPGFGALRNPYRAAFIASLLLAPPVGYGARWVIEWGRARLLYRQRWRARPQLDGLLPATWAMAALLAAVHLFEAWPGPQEIAPLPTAPSDAYQWVAAQEPGAALVWPLPRPVDDNARYQLWTIGAWTPLVNGHSGLYPADFLELYSAGAEFPAPRFLEFVKERFPVRYVVAHYGLAENGAAVRAAAADSVDLEEVSVRGDDVVYRLGNGTTAGWARRRLPQRMLAGNLTLATSGAAGGCNFRVLLDGVMAGDVRLPDRQGGALEGNAVYSLEVAGAAARRGPASLEMYFVGAGGLPRVDLYAALRPRRRARLEINGAVVLEGPVVVAVLEGGSGRLTFARATEADEAGAGAAVRDALTAAAVGDEVLLAMAEAFDYRLIERLRLLLDDAGAAASGPTLQDLGTTFAFRGGFGRAPGTALESMGGDNAELLGGDRAGDCRLAPIRGFEFGEGDSPR